MKQQSVYNEEPDTLTTNDISNILKYPSYIHIFTFFSDSIRNYPVFRAGFLY